MFKQNLVTERKSGCIKSEYFYVGQGCKVFIECIKVHFQCNNTEVKKNV